MGDKQPAACGSVVTWTRPTGTDERSTGIGHGLLQRWQTDATGKHWALVVPDGTNSPLPPMWVRSGDILELRPPQ